LGGLRTCDARGGWGLVNGHAAAPPRFEPFRGPDRHPKSRGLRFRLSWLLAEAAVDGYLAGLRAGGWVGSDHAVRTAIYASGAAKYSWFGPALAVRAARDDLGRSSYGQDTSAAAAIRRLTPLVTLIADWADQITGKR